MCLSCEYFTTMILISLPHGEETSKLEVRVKTPSFGTALGSISVFDFGLDEKIPKWKSISYSRYASDLPFQPFFVIKFVRLWKSRSE